MSGAGKHNPGACLVFASFPATFGGKRPGKICVAEEDRLLLEEVTIEGCLLGLHPGRKEMDVTSGLQTINFRLVVPGFPGVKSCSSADFTTLVFYIYV